MATEARTRQAMRATREMVGITLEALARSIVSPKTGKSLGVDTVTDIERRDVSYAISGATQAVWAKLKELKAKQDEMIAFALDRYDIMCDALPEDETPVVELRYWTSEAEYLENSTDAALDVAGDWRMANANNRRLAAILEAEGAIVRWTGTPIPR